MSSSALPSASSSMGSIRVGQKRPRGVAGMRDVSCDGFLNVDVTSGSGRKINGVPAKTLSPMTLGPVLRADGTTLALRFENAWQWSKAWRKAGHIKKDADGLDAPTPAWRAFSAKGFAQVKGRRRPFPRAYGPADLAFLDDKPVSYVESRKQFYVPVYRKLIAPLPIMDELVKLVHSGKSVMIIDGDGPSRSMYPNGMEMTPENWDRVLRDPSAPCGHGYVVAEELMRRCRALAVAEDMMIGMGQS